MAASEVRDNTEDWILPEGARPRSFADLESRVETALSVARASEAAIAEVGAAAIEAAEQARQAAELAERAAGAAQAMATATQAQPLAAVPASAPEAAVEPGPSPEDEWLLGFTHRAERLSARLERLQHC
jgi:hypothetical protein